MSNLGDPIPATDRVTPANVLFLCMHHSARSLLAEAALTSQAFRLGGPTSARAFSAGVYPSRQAANEARAFLSSRGLASQFTRQQNWRAFQKVGAPRIDFVVVLDARLDPLEFSELPGRPRTLCWDLPPPAALGRDDGYERLFDAISERCGALISALENNGGGYGAVNAGAVIRSLSSEARPAAAVHIPKAAPTGGS